MLKKITFLLLAFLLSTSSVLADTYTPFVTILIDRNRYMRKSVASKIAKRAVNLQPIPVNYRIKVSPRSNCYKISEWNSNQLNCFKTVRKDIRGRVLILTEPYIENGEIYTTGRSNVCIYYGTGVCNVTEKNRINLDRIPYAKIACAHEMGHLFGASHDNTMYGKCPSVMHEAPLNFVPYCNIRFSEISKNEILECNF